MANRYWVGGTGVWDASNTTPWSLTSGGAGGQSVPSTADTAFFDSVSNANTITLAYSPTLQTLRMDTFSGTFNANNQTITLSSGPSTFTANSSMTMLGSPSMNCISVNAGEQFIALANLTYGTININSATGTRTFGGNGFTINNFTRNRTGATIKLGNGTINNWNINGDSTVFTTITGYPSTLTITNSTKNLNWLTFYDIKMNTNPVTFYAGKNSFPWNTSKGIALLDGIFNYNNPKQKILVLESGTSWTVPNDFTTNNTIHLFGAGGGGGQSLVAGASAAGGGGGGYTQINNLNLTPGSTITYSIGLGGAANTNGSNTTFSTYSANGGFAGGVSSTTAVGGAGGTGLTYSGGSGGNSSYQYSGAGGGAGGPYGVGGNGAAPTASSSYGQGGGANGGGTNGSPSIASQPGAGGQSVYTLNTPRSQAISQVAVGDGGYGGGTGGSSPANPGGNGIDILNAVGGGGGGSSSTVSNSPSGNGGLYGGGGAGGGNTLITAGSGANGAVIIVYNTSPSPLKHRLDNTGTLKTGTYFNEFGNNQSLSFDFSANSYVQFTNSSAFSFGTSDFTIESFVYQTSRSQANVFATGNNNCNIFIQAIDGRICFYDGTTVNLSTTNLNLNSWNHLALVRSGTTVKIYLNGVNIMGVGVTNSSNYSQTFARIGNGPTTYININGFNGYISNLRVLKGTALYTSDFTPPNSPLTAITNTQLLLNTNTQNPFKDSSVNNFTATQANVVSYLSSPFTDNPKFTANNIGGNLNEVTNPGPKMRMSNTGIIYVSSVFDEYTGIE